MNGVITAITTRPDAVCVGGVIHVPRLEALLIQLGVDYTWAVCCANVHFSTNTVTQRAGDSMLPMQPQAAFHVGQEVRFYPLLSKQGFIANALAPVNVSPPTTTETERQLEGCLGSNAAAPGQPTDAERREAVRAFVALVHNEVPHQFWALGIVRSVDLQRRIAFINMPVQKCAQQDMFFPNVPYILPPDVANGDPLFGVNVGDSVRFLCSLTPLDPWVFSCLFIDAKSAAVGRCGRQHAALFAQHFTFTPPALEPMTPVSSLATLSVETQSIVSLHDASLEDVGQFSDDDGDGDGGDGDNATHHGRSNPSPATQTGAERRPEKQTENLSCGDVPVSMCLAGETCAKRHAEEVDAEVAQLLEELRANASFSRGMFFVRSCLLFEMFVVTCLMIFVTATCCIAPR